MKRLAITSNAVGTELVATVVVIAILSIPTFVSGWVLTICVALSNISILLPKTSANSQKSGQLFAVTQEKKSSVMVLTQTKLYSISDTISQAITPFARGIS